MAKSKRKTQQVDVWETGKLGRQEEYVVVSDSAAEQELDAALELQMISIRLQKQLISALKSIAKHYGIGYQPLIRDVLTRFVVQEQKSVMWEMFKKMKDQQEALEKLGSEIELSNNDDKKAA